MINGRLAVSRGEEKIAQSIRFLLATAKGERVMRPELGSGVHDLVFAPGNSQTETLVAHQVRETLVNHEPRIDVLDIKVERAAGALTTLLIAITYRIRENNAVTNLVYPYFITEGLPS